MRRSLAALAALPLFVPAPAAAETVRRVILVGLPGVTWEAVQAVRPPVLSRLAASGAAAALSVRTAVRGATPVRGYLTLGAGQRAFAPDDDRWGNLALPAAAPYQEGTAAQAAARQLGGGRMGAIVVPELGALAQLQQDRFGARPGALGEALARAGVRRAVVSAADLAVNPRGRDTIRRPAALALVDAAGTIDAGTLTGLLRPDPTAPFGVTTDPRRLEAAVAAALAEARVVVIDPGETLRAEEAAALATPPRAESLRRQALLRADALLGLVAAHLEPTDLLLVLAPSVPWPARRDQLTLLVAAGAGVRNGWVTSPLTRRPGLARLTDVAPTVLRALGIDPPDEMPGLAFETVAAANPRPAASLAALDRRSLFREAFVGVATGIFIALLTLLTAASFLVLLSPSRSGASALASVALAVLALPPASLLLRAAGAERLGVTAAAAALVALTAALAAAARLAGGPRRAGVALLVGGLALMVADLLAGAPLQLNAPFGYSPILGGRFYGNGNLGFAILFATGLLGLTGLADLRGHRTAPPWLGGGLAALVLLEGLPAFGADLGGVLAGVPAVALTYGLGRRWRLRPATVAAVATITLLGGVAALGIDLARPPGERTHLGAFAARVARLGWPAFWEVARRKAQANISLLTSTAWTYVIPLTVAVLLLLIWQPRGSLQQTLAAHPLLRAGLTGALVAGVAGFAANDSGIAVPAMVLAHTVPFFVLVALDREPAPLPPPAPAREQPAPHAP